MAKHLDITTVTNQLDMAELDTTPLSPEQLPTSVYHAITTSAKRFGDKTAIKYILDGDCQSASNIPFAKKITHQLIKVIKGKHFAQPYREISYQQVADAVTQVANTLTTLGIAQDDVTSLILPNFPEMYFALWGAETAGIANPINPLLDASIIKEIVSTAGSKVLIALGPVPGSDIWQKVLEVKDQIPSLEAVICLFGDDIPANKENKVPVFSFEKLIAKQDAKKLIAQAPQQQAICSYFHTGGTTGLPKLAKHLHLNELTNAAQINLISPMQQEDTVLVGLPIFHVNAAITGLSSMMLGSTILLVGPSGFRGKNVISNLLSILDNFNVAFMTAVPTVYAGLLQHLSTTKQPVTRPKNMKLAICGAAPLSPDLQRKFTATTKINLVEGYGSTEGTAVSTIMPTNSKAKEPAVGIPIPGVTLKIAEVNDLGELIRCCAPNEAGEIVIAGNNVFPGYVEPSHNKQLWLSIADDSNQQSQQYVRTGDLGKLDENGYLSLCGRKKELIIRGGHNIDPKMIEDVASSHADILLAAAVPRPDGYSGELPVLYVTLTEGSQESVESLAKYMKAHIPERAAIPKQIQVLDEMPLTAVGKLFKPELVCREIHSVITDCLSELSAKHQIAISVVPEKQHGTLASITLLNQADDIAQLGQQICQKLAAFSFHYQVVQQEKLLTKTQLRNTEKVAS